MPSSLCVTPVTWSSPIYEPTAGSVLVLAVSVGAEGCVVSVVGVVSVAAGVVGAVAGASGVGVVAAGAEDASAVVTVGVVCVLVVADAPVLAVEVEADGFLVDVSFFFEAVVVFSACFLAVSSNLRLSSKLCKFFYFI